MKTEGKIYLACCGVLALLGVGIAGAITSSADTADSLPDYTDTFWQCTPKTIQEDVNYLWKDSVADKTFGARVLYVKDVKEISRTKDALVCEAYVKATTSYYTNTYRVTHHIEEGKALVGLRVAY